MAEIKDPENTIRIELRSGTVAVETLRADQGTGARGGL